MHKFLLGLTLVFSSAMHADSFLETKISSIITENEFDYDESRKASIAGQALLWASLETGMEYLISDNDHSYIQKAMMRIAFSLCRSLYFLKSSRDFEHTYLSNLNHKQQNLVKDIVKQCAEEKPSRTFFYFPVLGLGIAFRLGCFRNFSQNSLYWPAFLAVNLCNAYFSKKLIMRIALRDVASSL